MSKKKTWRDVKPGDVVELGGRGWSVVKIKPKGKKAKLEIRFGKRESSGEVKLGDRVKIIERRGAASVAGPPLLDEHGTQQRWATKKELAAALAMGPKLPAGNGKAKKPPEPAAGGSWTKPKGDAEKMIVDLLSARLVGESKDEAEGYYVPPVDVSSVAAHLELFHGGIPEAAADDEGRMLGAHTAQHAAALKGEGVLAVTHWHTAKRP